MNNNNNNRNNNRNNNTSNNNNTKNNNNNTRNNNNNNNTKSSFNKINDKLKNGLSEIKDKTNDAIETTKPIISKTSNAFDKSIQSTKNVYKNTSDKIMSIPLIESFNKFTNDFQQTNSTMAKIIFVVFVFIIFGLMFRLGIYILSLFILPSRNPIVLDGMRSTMNGKLYNVNPNSHDPKPILRSINENQGMEFTWTTWLWINSTDYADNAPRLIFTKGNSVDTYKSEYMKKQFVMNSPGLYLYDDVEDTGKINSLSIILSLYDVQETEAQQNTSSPYEIITIRNMPMQKWINVVIRVTGRIVDIYINGTLTKRKTFERVVKQNYGNIIVGSSTFGADAYISSLRYFDHAIGNNTIQDIMYKGPNLNMDGSEMSSTHPPYLAMQWYMDDGKV